MKVLITGAGGFVGKNLHLALFEHKDIEIVAYGSEHSISQLPEILRGVDFVFHLAGVNRPQDPMEFVLGNVDLTKALCDALALEIAASGKKIPFVLASSVQATLDNPYGQSKLRAEQVVFAASKEYGFPAYVFRLPNVFGKWCLPNYNSVVATFCYNIARGLPFEVRDPATPLTLVYIDDLVARFVELLDGADTAEDISGFATVTPLYSITVGELADMICRFKESRTTLLTERVGTGFVRALYSTYISYLPVGMFKYSVPRYEDPRGLFVEMLRTQDSGQFSYFTAHPGITRGGHYHNSKTEKFLIIKGHARFRFRHMQTGEVFEITTHGGDGEVVDTLPGWAHDITNIGHDEMIVMLWTNENFDRTKPDTYASPL